MAKTFTRTAFALLIGMMALLAVATFVERSRGTAFASEHIYRSWWFAALWGALALSSLAAITMQALYRRKAVFLLHCSFGVILLGALLTFVTSQKGYVHLREGAEFAEFRSEKEDITLPLPFDISLERFEVEYYPGTDAPADYRSRVAVRDGNETFAAEISMNNILSHKGYRFYQASFDEDGKGSILSVNYDPYGIPVTYAGYILLAISMIWILLTRQAGFRQLLRHPLLRRAGMTAVILLAAAGARGAAPTISKENAERFGELQMLYGNRIAPVQTFARDFTFKVYGKPSYNGLSPEQVLAGWIFYPEQWQFEPMIKVKDEALMRQIGATGKYAAFTNFFDAGRNYKLSSYWNRLHQGGAKDNLLKAVESADEKVQLIVMLQAGDILAIFPDASQGRLRWMSPVDGVDGLTSDDSLFVRGIFPLLYDAVVSGDDAGTGELIGKIAAFQRKLAASTQSDPHNGASSYDGGITPGGRQFINGVRNKGIRADAGNGLLSETKVKAELFYNRADLITILYRANLTTGILAFVYFCAIALSGRRRRWIEAAFLTLLTASFVALTANLALRWYISGHVPLSNGYETMMFTAWSVLLITLVFHRKLFLITASGFMISGFTLLVSALGIMNPQITPLMPVLSSPWLSLHVSLIMVSYALLAFMMLNGLISLILILAGDPSPSGKVAVQVETLQLISRLFLYPAVFFLAAGIFVGAVWANVSWGRYWGWDPKEVWALITMMLYSLPFHTRSIKRFVKPVFFHGFCLWAFFSVLMTYFGVNYLLGGMHSYSGDLELGTLGIVIPVVVILMCGFTLAASFKYKRCSAAHKPTATNFNTEVNRQ